MTARKILAAALALLCALLAAEASLRLAGRLYSLYRLGTKSPDPGAYRVLCLGDSFTFGVGADKGMSYPEQLERLLNARRGRVYRVYNAGEPGMNSSQALSRLPALLDRYRPHAVVVLIGMNNSTQLAGSDPAWFEVHHPAWRIMHLCAAALNESRLRKLGLRALRAVRVMRARFSRNGPAAGIPEPPQFDFERMLSEDRLEEAEPLLRRLVDAWPQEVTHRLNLARLLSEWESRRGVSRSTEALSAVEAATKLAEYTPFEQSAFQLRVIIRTKLGIEKVPSERAMAELLRHDMASILMLTSHRAKAIVLDYPSLPGIIQRDACAATECAFVDIHAVFERLLRVADETSYFSGDSLPLRHGHPNSAGYAVIARATAAAIDER